LYRQEKIASFWRSFCFLGGGQHCGQIPSQLDPKLAFLRSQDNRLDEPTERFRGFQAGAVGLERSGELFDLCPVEVGHARVQEGRRFVAGLDLVLKLVPARGQAEHFFLPLAGRHRVVQYQAEQLLPARLDLAQLTLGHVEASALLHP
jgi:hypothetical protein